jgi:hypothetical protein
MGHWGWEDGKPLLHQVPAHVQVAQPVHARACGSGGNKGTRRKMTLLTLNS